MKLIYTTEPRFSVHPITGPILMRTSCTTALRSKLNSVRSWGTAVRKSNSVVCVTLIMVCPIFTEKVCVLRMHTSVDPRSLFALVVFLVSTQHPRLLGYPSFFRIVDTLLHLETILLFLSSTAIFEDDSLVLSTLFLSQLLIQIVRFSL